MGTRDEPNADVYANRNSIAYLIVKARRNPKALGFKDVHE